VCRNHRPRWHDPLAQWFGIGGAKYVSFLCIWACAKQGGVAKPRIVRGIFLFFACVGAASDAMQSWQQMRVMARLYKRARARWGGAKWWKVFLLKCNATTWRHAHKTVFDMCRASWLTLTPFLSHSPYFYKYPSLSLFFLFLFFLLFFFFFVISLLFLFLLEE